MEFLEEIQTILHERILVGSSEENSGETTRGISEEKTNIWMNFGRKICWLNIIPNPIPGACVTPDGIPAKALGGI